MADVNGYKAIYCPKHPRTIGNSGEVLVAEEKLGRYLKPEEVVHHLDCNRSNNAFDNAIRKWCDRYNLPRIKTIINSYSDTDWQKI